VYKLVIGLKIVVVWNVIRCSLVESYKLFGGICYCSLRVWNTEEPCYFETSVTLKQDLRFHTRVYEEHHLLGYIAVLSVEIQPTRLCLPHIFTLIS
jgi:hypothetical protein